MNFSRTTTFAAVVLAITAAAACEGDIVSHVGSSPPIEGATPPPPARDAARMKVDQLRDSIPVVAGIDKDGLPISWSYELNGKRANLFQVLGSTLGDPDYISITEEPAVPNAMYLKFSTDMALNVCLQMAAADVAVGNGPRTLSRFASLDGSASDADIEANIRYLHLRFLGERIGDGDALAALRAVYDAGVAAAVTPIPPAEGWRAVCVALLQSPAFHIY